MTTPWHAQIISGAQDIGGISASAYGIPHVLNSTVLDVEKSPSAINAQHRALRRVLRASEPRGRCASSDRMASDLTGKSTGFDGEKLGKT